MKQGGQGRWGGNDVRRCHSFNRGLALMGTIMRVTLRKLDPDNSGLFRDGNLPIGEEKAFARSSNGVTRNDNSA